MKAISLALLTLFLSILSIQVFHGHQSSLTIKKDSTETLTAVDHCQICDYYSHNLKQLDTPAQFNLSQLHADSVILESAPASAVYTAVLQNFTNRGPPTV